MTASPPAAPQRRLDTRLGRPDRPAGTRLLHLVCRVPAVLERVALAGLDALLAGPGAPTRWP